MKTKSGKKRWTIINVPDELKNDIVDFAKQNGYTVARALKELSKKELRHWKRNQKEKQ